MIKDMLDIATNEMNWDINEKLEVLTDFIIIQGLDSEFEDYVSSLVQEQREKQIAEDFPYEYDERVDE